MIQAIMAGLIAIGLPLVIKVLLGLGIAFVTYTGADYAITAAESFIATQVGGLPSDMYQIILLAGFDQGIQIFFAAWAAHIGILTTMGVFTRMKVSPA